MKAFQAIHCRVMKCKILLTWPKTATQKRTSAEHRWSLNIRCEWPRCLSSLQQRALIWALTISNQTVWWLKPGVSNQMPKRRCLQELMLSLWRGLTSQQTLNKSLLVAQCPFFVVKASRTVVRRIKGVCKIMEVVKKSKLILSYYPVIFSLCFRSSTTTPNSIVNDRSLTKRTRMASRQLYAPKLQTLVQPNPSGTVNHLTREYEFQAKDALLSTPHLSKLKL